MSDKTELRPPPARTVAPSGRHRRGWIVPFIVVLLLAGAGYAGWRLFGATPKPAARAGAGAPQSVGVATIATGNLDEIMTGLGAVTPLATVTVKNQVNGILQQLSFTEGQMVHAGDVLAQIDPRPYQAALDQAQGTLLRDTALLGQARADNVRFQTLNRQDSIARQQADDQVFLIKQDEGLVAADKGAVQAAQVNLAYTRITAPVDGRVGIRLVDVGNYVQTTDTGLFVVTQLQPISVIFTLPEDTVDQVQAQMNAGSLQVTAYDRTDTTLLATGTLATTDNQIDNTTGTIKLRAMFPNDDRKLFPQQFVNAHLRVQTLTNVVLAPQAAVQQGAPGSFVYLVKPDNTVGIQVVKTGIAQNGNIQITDGLKAGDKVVVDGLDRLRDGAKISIAPPPGQAPATPAAPAGRQRRAPSNG
ncbi:efflux RND transporter periplasmic adaptor subunit [Acidisphaera sp. L21]|uniref:efflux RND transporter periplasmic adaptor subunit n=1 Tax=Acidisphaera sp. L21 TaxID=1641851 RepID=UPI00131E8B26|nr:efflux RND transporter periplasmic adaptor subunit [Acidisphaera sp. L21]